jgi:hypothetical protein
MNDPSDINDGDPVCCPTHGWVIRSACGMFDAPCGGCEMEMDMPEDEVELARVAALSRDKSGHLDVCNSGGAGDCPYFDF